MGMILDTSDNRRCQHCIDDDARYEELLSLLAEMNKFHETDPKTLCSATSHDFYIDHAEFTNISAIQAEAFKLASVNFLAWTRM